MFFRDPAEQFGAQFERTETGYLYRKGLRVAPVEVTVAERDAFVDAYARRARLLRWALTAALILMIAALVTIEVAFDIELPEWSTFVGTMVLIAGFLFVWSRAWNAPWTLVKSRAAVGPPPSRAELQRATYAQLSWGQLTFSSLIMFVGMLANLPSVDGPMTTARWGALLFFGLAFLAGCSLAVSKFRLGR